MTEQVTPTSALVIGDIYELIGKGRSVGYYLGDRRFVGVKVPRDGSLLNPELGIFRLSDWHEQGDVIPLRDLGPVPEQGADNYTKSLYKRRRKA